MFLFVLLLLALDGGGEFFDEVKPLIEYAGDENLKSVFKEAGELAEVITAVKSLYPVNNAADNAAAAEKGGGENGFPLEAVVNFADGDILRAFSDYLA